MRVSSAVWPQGRGLNTPACLGGSQLSDPDLVCGAGCAPVALLMLVVPAVAA